MMAQMNVRVKPRTMNLLNHLEAADNYHRMALAETDTDESIRYALLASLHLQWAARAERVGLA